MTSYQDILNQYNFTNLPNSATYPKQKEKSVLWNKRIAQDKF